MSREQREKNKYRKEMDSFYEKLRQEGRREELLRMAWDDLRRQVYHG